MSFITNITSWIKRHKIGTALIVIVVAFISWRVVKAMNSTTGQTTYVLGTVEKGTVIASIAGTGQVSASNQVDIKSKASGDLISLNATVGQSVGAGALLGRIDSGDAAYQLETARLDYDQQINANGTSVRNANDTVTTATTNLADAYTSARTTLATAATNLTDIVNTLSTMEGTGYLGTNNQRNISSNGRQYTSRASDSWYNANKAVDDFMKQYRTVSSSTSDDQIASLLTIANKAAVTVAESAKYAKDAVVYMRDNEGLTGADADSAYTSVTGLVTTANSTVSDTQHASTTITDDIRALNNAKQDLTDTQGGSTTLDLRSKEIALQQKQEAYNNYFIRAPFSGIIASVSGKQGQSVSTNDTIATIITKQKIAEISLNEIDAAKVKVGQKATITFDAIDGLTITGTVVEADLVGTVSQGVVSYTVKIGFDTDDDRIKPGMTANANIITGTSQDVLTVAASAVKTQGDTTYVEVPNETVSATTGSTGVALATPPKQVPVITGLTSDDLVEIVSGLTEGETYVIRSIAATTTKTTSAPSILGGQGGRTSGGNGAVRAFTR